MLICHELFLTASYFYVDDMILLARWVDDFAVKKPAPDAAPLSWDKRPVINSAHYFLFGRVNPKDLKGILRESGFGVEFPNDINGSPLAHPS